jgi:UDP-glucose 4-epimerase
MAQKRCLVTGGAGFIGSHLATRLIEDGHAVTVVDNCASGRPANLAHIASKPGFAFHKIDVTNLAELGPVMAGCDWVFHLAGLADIVPSIQHPLAYHHANVDGTVCVMEAARAAGVKKVVYAASSSCYGIPDVFPTPETAPAKPQYPYALSKYLGEQIVMHWSQVYKIPALSLRLFNVYGPRSRTTGAYGAVFGVFLAQRLAGKPYTVVGDGKQTRDFTFVSDVANAFAMAAASDDTGLCMNVGSGNTYSINRLVELLGGPVVHVPKRPGEPDKTFADTAQIKKVLGWSPRVTFEEGVGQMIQNIELWRDAPVWDPASIAQATQDWFKYLK